MSKIVNVVDILSKLLLPIVIAVIGVSFNYIQYQNNQQQKALDRTTNLLQQMASTDPSQRKAAIIVMDYLVKEGEIEPDLVTSALFVAVEDTNVDVANLASFAFSNIAKKNEALKGTIKGAVQADTSLADYLSKTDLVGDDLHASLKSKDDFVICESIQNRMPAGTATKFPPGDVWVWARVNAPLKTEKLRLDWVEVDSSQTLHSETLVVSRNTASGYRTWATKTLPKPGKYEARLYNSVNRQIGSRKFEIIQLTAK